MPLMTTTDMVASVNEAGRTKRLLESIAGTCTGCQWRVGNAASCARNCIAKTAKDILEALKIGNFSLGLIDNLTGKLEARNNDACYKEAARKAKVKRNHHKKGTSK